MTKRLLLAVIAVSYAASAAVYPKVPEPYFGVDPRQTLSIGRAMITFLLPTAAALTWGLLSWLERRDPVRERSASFDRALQALVFRMVLLIIGLHAVVLASLVSGTHLAARGVPVLVGLVFVAIGDVLPRLRPNLAFGLRTPGALLNRGVWMRTHRFAGYATVSLGGVIVVAGLVLPRRIGEAAILAAGTCAAIAIACYSRRLGRGVGDGSQ